MAGANRLVNEASPIVDARLPDGSRVNVVLAPIALDGPIVTIRKFSKEGITMEQLISWNSVSKEVSGFLARLVEAGYNIFISGGTGSGKTTFLNALSQYIPKTERIITIEDNAELRLQDVPNLVRLEARNANVEGTGAVTIRDLIKSALRMRPDRISGISGATSPISLINQDFLHQVYPRSMKASNFRHFYLKSTTTNTFLYLLW